MLKMVTMNAALFGLLGLPSVMGGSLTSRRVSLDVRSKLDTRIANVHITYPQEDIGGILRVTYGGCDASSTSIDDAHHTVGQSNIQTTHRLIWRIPEDAPPDGCLSAWLLNPDSDWELSGQSTSLPVNDITQMQKKRWYRRSNENGSLQKRYDELTSVVMNNSTGIDSNGPWFDGVALLKSRNVSAVDVARAKKTNIAIIGGGMSGLITSLLLDSVGLHNYTIIEASQRLGGRIRTVYLEGGPADYQYQEMGPMRFPESITSTSTNETLPIKDHQLVFQLVDELNILNANRSQSKVNFIPWLQASPNAPYDMRGARLPNGDIPRMADLAAFPDLLGPQLPPDVQAATGDLSALSGDPTLIKAALDSVFSGHKLFIGEFTIENGLDDFSEFAYIHNQLGYELNVTDLVTSNSAAHSVWSDIYDNIYFSATTWRTVDQGLDRIPQAFHPLVDERTIYGRMVSKLSYSNATNKVSVSWKDKPSDRTSSSAEYDYAVVAVPFSVVRQWQLPSFTHPLSSAIQNLNYASACKVSAQFRTRFWEHGDRPIYGGCGLSDAFGSGQICYPSYKINSTLPGVILASYATGDSASRLVSWSDEKYLQQALSKLAEIHGEVVYEQFTGKFNKTCWLQQELTAAGWADPTVGQHELFIPSYFETQNNLIFVGEHTSYTHAWIAAALESGIRGTVQLLLELGLVDEAKEITNKWMARWIHV